MPYNNSILNNRYTSSRPVMPYGSCRKKHWSHFNPTVSVSNSLTYLWPLIWYLRMEPSEHPAGSYRISVRAATTHQIPVRLRGFTAPLLPTGSTVCLPTTRTSKRPRMQHMVRLRCLPWFIPCVFPACMDGCRVGACDHDVYSDEGF